MVNSSVNWSISSSSCTVIFSFSCRTCKCFFKARIFISSVSFVSLSCVMNLDSEAFVCIASLYISDSKLLQIGVVDRLCYAARQLAYGSNYRLRNFSGQLAICNISVMICIFNASRRPRHANCMRFKLSSTSADGDIARDIS